MCSMALIRLLTAKNGINSLTSRSFSLYSMNCLKRNSQKLLSTDLNQKNDLLFNNNCRAVSSSGGSVDRNHNPNHSKIWSVERLLSLGLLAVIPMSFAIPMPAMDYLLSLSLVTHIHWGLEAIVVDYVRPNIFGTIVPKLALGSVYLLSILSVGGLFYFNYTDVGLVQAIRMVAKI